MPGLSPVQRTIRELRDKGIVCAIAQHFNPYVGEHGIRQDMFGILDVVALDVVDTIGIQCCGTDFKIHFEKLTVEKSENSIYWLTAPTRKLQIWSWRKLKLKRGGKAMRWTPRIVEITLADFKGDD